MTERTPRSRIGDRELVDVIERVIDTGDCPVATAPVVADETGLSEFYIRDRLAGLADSGEIERCKTGGVWIYWLD